MSEARDPALRRWEIAGLVALAIVAATIPLSLFAERDRSEIQEVSEITPAFSGTLSCRDCHKVEYDRWRGSDHDLAMDEANEKTVLGDFNDATFTENGVTTRFTRRDGKYFVFTEGPDGQMVEYPVAYVFGHEPLQQYLIPFPGGRLQCLTIAWDTERKRWFGLYPGRDIPPGDWLHWTRNAQTWNFMCAECHSTNLKKNYDPKTNSYNTTWSDIDVGCEACHGPGSRHVAWAKIAPMARPELPDDGLVVRTSGIAPEQLVELCAPCHSRRSELGDYDHTEAELLDRMIPTLLQEGLYHPDGQILEEVYVYASFLQSKMYARGVSCHDCHDSHSMKLLKEGNDLCLQCHQREVYDVSEHHIHKKVFEGKPSPGALCVKCHAVEQPFMVIDWRADHSFRVPRPDLSATIGTPNACTQAGCHADKPLSWSLDAYRRWYGAARKPSFGTTFALARRGDPEAREDLLRIAESGLQPAIVRATALSLLAQYDDPAADAAMRKSLMSDEPLLRYTAVSDLAPRDARDAVALLAPLLSDPIAAVRLAAASQVAGVPSDLLKPYQQEALDRALAEYRTAMDYSLDSPSSPYNLGNLEAKLGHPAESERYYRMALTVDDLFLAAKMNLATLLSSQGRNAEAETLLRQVVAAYPDNGDAAYSLGLLLVEMGNTQEGLTFLNLAAERLPLRARVHYNLGLLLQQEGRLDDAERELRRAVELDPNGHDPLLALADHLARRGRTGEALVFADRLAAAHPESPAGRQIRQALTGRP